MCNLAEENREVSESSLNALLPCPFCGFDAYVRTRNYAGQAGWAVQCRGCEAEIFFHDSRWAHNAAIETWNKRKCKSKDG